MKESLSIVKIGGNVINDEEALHEFLKSFSSITGKKILVHGGGKIATSIGKQLNIEPHYKDGRRITDDKTIDLVTMVYAGLINKKIVAFLQSLNCNSIGLTGADVNLIPAIKRPVKEIDFGWVGDISADSVPVEDWEALLDNNWLPVVSPITHDMQGHLLNTNADTVASVLAFTLSDLYDVSLFFCFEKDGVLTNPQDDSSFVRKLNPGMFKNLKESGNLADGILPKLINAFDAVDNGVAKVVIGNSEKLQGMISGISGTKIIPG